MRIDLAALLEASQKAAAAQLERQQAYFNQPGYICTVNINRNAPYNAQTGHLGQVKGMRAENGAPELPPEYSLQIKAWVFGADQILAKHDTAVRLEYFLPASHLDNEDTYPITQIDAIVSKGGAGGKIYINPSNPEETAFVRIRQPIPEGWTAQQEYVFRVYLSEGFIPDTDKAWNPQAGNPFAGQTSEQIAQQLASNSLLFKKSQAEGLAGWKAQKAAATAELPTTEAVNSVLAAAASLPTTEPTKTRSRTTRKPV